MSTRARGQVTVEVALLIFAVAVALLAFFHFMTTSVSSRFKGGADAIGQGLLYDPSRSYPPQTK